MPFQPGNKLGGRRREKFFREALLMELSEAGENRRELRLIARKLIDKANTGDVTAIREIADRIDGKVPQGIVGGDEDEAPVQFTEIRRIIVNGRGDVIGDPGEPPGGIGQAERPLLALLPIAAE